jgi:beta-galactosidase
VVRRLGALLATAIVVCGLGAASAPARSVELDKGWRFALVNPNGVTDPTGAYADAQDPAYDDSSWRSLDLPHDWSIELDPTNAPGTTTNSGTGFLQGGLGWYRKTFTLPRSLAGKRISVEFDGIYMDSRVYFNGRLVGSHPYGYTGFAVDLTDEAHTDGSTPNVLAVEVRNQLPSSRWYSGSGIYRHVHLVVTDPVHIARHGIFVTTPDVEHTIGSGYADVHVETKVDSPDAAPTAVRSEVVDARGRKVAVARSGGTADLRVRHPHLWSTDDPYLYTLRTSVLAGGRVVDRTSTRFGIRWFRIDPDQGLYLNGKHMKVYGVDLHHDLGALGAAVNRDAVMRQMRIMKSMGVNALRTSHNPPSPEMIDVCQRLGIVMMVEAFDTWRTPKVPFDYGRFFDANSDADIKEMVDAAKNSPAVILWSIGNEIPDSTSVSVGLPIAKRLIADIRSIDTTRPIVIGSDKYRSVPAPGSGADQILGLLDGLGLNYNTAASVDALHARYPGKFLFESESSSETSSRGVYQDPDYLNTGENYTPGKRATSSYDNNMASWTMSGEYGLKKDRDRKYFLGEFLWSGIDYIGEPTPYDVFPVKSSFFGAVDTAGFPKDMYWLFRSQWTSKPMVHLLPMNWTDHEPGEPVQVWAYANVDTVELFLDGRSLGVRRFDHKTTTDGRPYLETTEATGDDKTVTSGPFPGSYTSPNGSAGKLHLTWNVPFAPGTLVAVARRDGREVARDEIDTDGARATVRLTPDRKVIAADGRSLSFVTADVVDSPGVVVPGADDELTFSVSGGRLVGTDNGRQESAENYKSPTRRAFNGKALAIVQSGDRPGPITVSVNGPGLQTATTTIVAKGGHGRAGAAAPTPRRRAVGRATGPTADASFSGRPDTLPAAMLDGVTDSGGWSSFYVKAATALLPAISKAHPTEWVSVSWPSTQTLTGLRAYFTTDAQRTLPSAVQVTYWNGSAFVPVANQQVDWATASNQPSTITFDEVRTSTVRLKMTSPFPDASNGFLQIAELRAVGGG